MLFNSLHFLIFFPTVTAMYFLLPYRWRWLWLLAASYYFYMCWRIEYVLLLLATTAVDYWAGLKMGENQTHQTRRLYLSLSILSNLSLLFFFKYFDFFNGSLKELFNHYHLAYPIPMLHLLLPIGISFHTFQGLSYSIDVYRGVHPPEKHFGIFALYIAFFPQMVAGPIERPGDLIPQFRQHFDFDYQRITNGLKLMAWGFAKKLIIADSLATIVDAAFKAPRDQTPFELLVAVYSFTFQIYCDFSGYTDIARGSARVLGLHLVTNFDRPYLSTSIVEFWQRWHISLSTWFRDYVYFPLGGNRVSSLQWARNIIATFLISGLWHGANWTYVIWGALHAALYLLSVKTAALRNAVAGILRLKRFPRLLYALALFTTFHAVLISWIFFRANTLSDALYICKTLFDYLWHVSENIIHLHTGRSVLGYRSIVPVEKVAWVAIAMMLLVEAWQGKTNLSIKINTLPAYVRWPGYVVLLLSILLCGSLQVRQFIYFQF